VLLDGGSPPRRGRRGQAMASGSQVRTMRAISHRMALQVAALLLGHQVEFSITRQRGRSTAGPFH
jgi:hypothetical protein